MPINFKPSKSGTTTVPKYESVVERDGSIRLVPAGERQLDLEIQADRDAGDINIIVRRYAAGDTNVLNRVQGYYGDIMDLPKTRQEMLQAVLSAEKHFDDLPMEIRELFNNDWRQAFAAMDTEKFDEIIKNFKEPEPPKENDTKE